jgi:ATP-dependent Clp protease ATP-binding subunit ClpB
MLADRDLQLELTQAALQWLADKGYDPVYGARPLKRVIQRELQNPLATKLLEGSILDGQSIAIDAVADGLTINGQAVHGAVPPQEESAWRAGRPVLH